MNTVIIKNHGFCIGINEIVFNSSLIILNCVVYNKCCILETYFDTNYVKHKQECLLIYMIRSCFILDVFNNMTIFFILKVIVI